MLRGAQRNMIVVRTRDSRMFEEAYFVIRRDRGLSSVAESDMLWEANRILEKAVLPTPAVEVSGKRRGRLRSFLWFLAGLAGGGGTVGLLWFFL